MQDKQRDDDRTREIRDERPEPVRARTEVTGAPDLWAGLRDCRHRFDELQTEFIEEPRAAVEKAERLIGDAVSNMMAAMQDRIKSIHTDYDSDHEDTERLRLAMRSYRELMDSLMERPAA